MRKSIFMCSYQRYVQEKGIDGVIDLAYQAGYREIELYPTLALREENRLEVAKRIREFCDERDMVSSCFSYGINVMSDPVSAVKELKTYVDVAAALGSPYLHHTLFMQLSHSGVLPLFQEMLPKAVPVCQEVCDYAAEKGITCLYEDQGYVFNGVERMEQLLWAIDRPNTGICADLGNALFADEMPEVLLGRLGSYVKHVHVKDYIVKPPHTDPGNGWMVSRNGNYLRDTIIGHGAINFALACRILKGYGYTGAFSLEYAGWEEVLSAIDTSFENLERYYNE